MGLFASWFESDKVFLLTLELWVEVSNLSFASVSKVGITQRVEFSHFVF